MNIRENVSLAELTTFKVGGDAAYVADCQNEEDITTALMFAHERGLPWYVLGGGSNVLASDLGYQGVILRMQAKGMVFMQTEPTSSTVIAGAGTEWDTFVQETVERGYWGIENLAGIPGTVGASPVQNIGAYGAEVADTISGIDVFDVRTKQVSRLTPPECGFGYRESMFKHDPSFIILRVAFKLGSIGAPQVAYADLASYAEKGAALDTPQAIAAAVREIRSYKFPNLATSGTAGSFFKNPTVSENKFKTLQAKYPGMQGFSTPNGTKISLAWILDKVLHLNGFMIGNARLFERQPLVIVVEGNATSSEINILASEVEKKVFDATGIKIEREVRSL